ncbi:MAG TPA: lytic transglycosylase domain-containing protein [Novosphingobium sp.]
MSRLWAVDSVVSDVAAALLALSPLVPTVAHADVLEIGTRGAAWVAGGPAAATEATTFDLDAPLAAVPQGTPVTDVAPTAVPDAYRARVAELAAKYDLSPALIEALVWQESRWRSGAVSPAGARGLAQLMPGTARQMGVNPDDPHANLEGGARYLRAQLDAFGGDIEKALAAYNAGPGRVQAAGGIPRIRETQNYVASIMARLTAPILSAPVRR